MNEHGLLTPLHVDYLVDPVFGQVCQCILEHWTVAQVGVVEDAVEERLAARVAQHGHVHVALQSLGQTLAILKLALHGTELSDWKISIFLC